MLCSFFYFQNPSGKLPPKAKPYAHSQLVIRLCCDSLNARTALLILPARTGYKPIGCIVRKRGNDIRYLGQSANKQAWLTPTIEPMRWYRRAIRLAGND
jgi:hypothetical protein